MEPLVSFTDVEVFEATVLSSWIEVCSPWPIEPVSQDPHPCCNCSCRSWAHPRGFLSLGHSESQSITTARWATTRTEAPTTPPWEMMPLQSTQSTSDHKPPCPPPCFAEIACALQGQESMESGQPLVIIGILPEDVIDPHKVMGVAVTVSWLL